MSQEYLDPKVHFDQGNLALLFPELNQQARKDLLNELKTQLLMTPGEILASAEIMPSVFLQCKHITADVIDRIKRATTNFANQPTPHRLQRWSCEEADENRVRLLKNFFQVGGDRSPEQLESLRLID